MEIRWLRKDEINKVMILLEESFPVDTNSFKIQKNLNDQNRFLVAVMDEQLVGVMLVRTVENFVENFISFHLDNICVKKQYRNQGIASQMLQKIEIIAREEGIDYIDLTASNYREVAHHVYLKNGYEMRESCLFRKTIK